MKSLCARLRTVIFRYRATRWSSWKDGHGRWCGLLCISGLGGRHLRDSWRQEPPSGALRGAGLRQWGWEQVHGRHFYEGRGIDMVKKELTDEREGSACEHPGVWPSFASAHTLLLS